MGLTPRIEFTDLNTQYERHFLLHNYRLLLDDHGWQYPNRKSSFTAFFGFYIYANSFAYRQDLRKDISDLPDRVKERCLGSYFFVGSSLCANAPRKCFRASRIYFSTELTDTPICAAISGYVIPLARLRIKAWR